MSMAKKVRGEGIRLTMAGTRGAVGCLETARVWLVQEGIVETRGTETNSMPSCVRWRSEHATSGMDMPGGFQGKGSYHTALLGPLGHDQLS